MYKYISDLHFCHTNIIKYENRPFFTVEEMNTAMIENWNKAVTASDIVIVGGDFAFCNGRKANELLHSLNGNKILVTGNHDSFLRDHEFDRRLFKRIVDIYDVKDDGDSIACCHYPMLVWNKKHHGALHFYGHIHYGGMERHSEVLASTSNMDNAYNIGADVLGFTPRTKKETIEINNKLFRNK